MSKLSQLKQEAYQAGKKRDWGLAVTIYEQILEIDKSNPMVINEMGDLCLKAGETTRAIRHFLAAAARYRTTGLLNNAVAIYKKILRYETENQNAHWYLAETRASQGLLVEGEDHAIHFLDGSESVSGDIKEIFLKRCTQLFDLYANSPAVMEKLLPIFRTWNLGLEAARTRALLACFSHAEGEVEVALQAMQDIRERNPEVCNYPEFQKLQKLLDPGAATAARKQADVNSISLDDPAPKASVAPAPTAAHVEPLAGDEAPVFDADPFGMGDSRKTKDSAPALEIASEPESEPAIEIPDVPGDETSFASVATEIQSDATSHETIEGAEADEDGCFDLSLDDDSSSFEDLVAQAASGVTEEETFVIEDEPGFDPLGIPDVDEVDLADPVADLTPAAPEPAAQKVDLLAQILSDERGSRADHENSQLAAITSDIGAQVGGGEQDAASLYEMGLVYLDMGLFDQAVDSFEKAAQDQDYVLRGLEMAGITLLKAQRAGDAIAALERGRQAARPGTREYLGLVYHLAGALEQSGQENAALDLYQEIASVDSSFLDVKSRLADLSGV